MSSSSGSTFLTAVNLFQSAAHEQKLPSGLVEREGSIGSMNSTPLPFRQPSISKRKPHSPRNRTYTAPSLYAAFEKSLSDDTQTDHRSRAISSPDPLSFSGSFMQNRSLPASIAQRQCHANAQNKSEIRPGCILPGPAYTTNPFELGSVKAYTVSGSPAWFCRHDRLVIFDGIQTHPESGVKTFLCRTSKGLEAARKQCPRESVYVDLACDHCTEMLGRKKWAYVARVRRLSVCHNCRERCLQEEENKRVEVAKDAEMKIRRDSFLVESPPTTIGNFDGPNNNTNDLRNVRSERQLRGMVALSVDESPDVQHPIGLESPSSKIRKVKSEQRLPQT